MSWFVYRSCRYFFYYVKAVDRAAADALFAERFFPLDTTCEHCDNAPLIEEIEEWDAEGQAELNAVDLAALPPDEALFYVVQSS